MSSAFAASRSIAVTEVTPSRSASTSDSRRSGSESVTNMFRRMRVVVERMSSKTCVSSAAETGFVETVAAPFATSCSVSSAPEMTCMGMLRVFWSCRKRSNSTQPSMSAKPRSSVIASGTSFRARARVPAPAVESTPFSPADRASPSNRPPKVGSSSTIRTTRSSAEIESRSSVSSWEGPA